MKRIMAIILAVLMLAGCQLASEEKKDDRAQDKLVGMFLTFEHLNLDFDMEGLLEDHPEALHGDGVVVSDPEFVQYAGKLPVTVSDDGWVVPGYEGLSFGRLVKEDYSTTIASEAVSEVNSTIATGDDGDLFQVEGIIHFPEESEVMFCCNPVYQTQAGEYYVVQGDSFQSQMGLGAMSQSITQEISWTVDGEKTSYAAEFTATAQGVTVADKVTLIWMSEDQQEISRAEYAPGQLPESARAEGEYLLVVEENRGVILNRMLVQPGEEFITVYYKGEQPWCLPDTMEIIWE